jgi:hypothetical protein
MLIRYWKFITAVLFLIITALSLFPLPELPEIPGNDKTMHFLAYGAFAFPVSFVKPKKYFYYLLLFGLWSGLIEILQPYVNRYGEWNDFYANCTGIFFGFLMATLISSFFKAKRD